ncbi:MAG TPA: hypothetical protein VEN79_12335 [Terriglobia bacterium]|nr:hypothetical protein [Terriglobia bacterium]
MPSQTARRIAWPACFILVLVSAFFLSGTRQPPLELDPSWQVALEYATAHHLQFGTQIVFTFGPLGFLAMPYSLGHLLGVRIAFALFWSALVALAATTLAKRLPGWVRYAFLAWLMVFALSEGLDQTAFFIMACGALLLLSDNPEQRWQAAFYVFAFIVLSLIKDSFLTAAFASLVLVVGCWITQRKLMQATGLALAAPAGFIVCWMTLGQSPSHLAISIRHALELESGYSGAMSLVPKTPVLCAALAGLALFMVSLSATIMRARGGLLHWAVVITLAQYTFLAWKEGFTRSGDWHTFVFLWFLPLGMTLFLLNDLPGAPSASHRWVLNAAFGTSMALCLVASHFQIPGFAWRQVTEWPRRITHNAQSIFAILRGRPDDLYADCRDSRNMGMLILDHAKDVIGNEPVDVMNYLLLAAVVNKMNYQPRPVVQGFVAYTPALQSLNQEYFRSTRRPHFVMLCQQATDGRFPALEDSAALNYVLNNYVPVARDGRFVILQQQTAEDPAFHLVHEESLRFGEKLDLRPWAHRPLFMTVAIAPSLLGRAATLLYQQHPLYIRISRNLGEERYRLVPSMADRPFLVNPLLDSNYDVMNLYASYPGKELESMTFERPPHGSFEFRDQFTVRLYTAPEFPNAAKKVSVGRMLADVQGRVFWPLPTSVESAAPARLTVFHGTVALVVRAPSKILMEIPANSASFSGYLGVVEEACTRNGNTQGVAIAIVVKDASGQIRRRLDRLLKPLSRADDRGRLSFRIPIDIARDRTITLATDPASSGNSDGSWSIWSQCRFEELQAR